MHHRSARCREFLRSIGTFAKIWVDRLSETAKRLGGRSRRRQGSKHKRLGREQSEKNGLRRSALTISFVIAAGAVLIAGCASAPPRIGVPIALANTVEVAGVGRVRAWGDREIPNIDLIATQRLEQIRSERPQLLGNRGGVMSYLAISGGGSDGAFGAGFLNGWTAAGTRPEFEIVTGVSTGALIAPFAFLGPAYDRKLKEVYTEYSTEDLIEKQVLAGLLGGDSVTSTAPMANLIRKYVTDDMLKEIAAEHAKGRRLLVGTTNADQERPVIWDMGRIASLNTNRARSLFRRILLASSALPGLFPPVMIKVTDTDLKRYEEMHVDGGVTENAFLLPLHLDLSKFDRRFGVRWRRQIFVIANAKTTPTPKLVKRNVFDIAGRSIATLIRQQLEGDLIKIYLRAKDNGIKFQLANIPSTFDAVSEEAFDQRYMRKLFKVGYDAALNGYRWNMKPPGI